MAQFLRPDANITQTNFTGGFAEIDEVTASDADYAYSADRQASVLEVGLSDPAGTPGSGTCTVRYRIAKVDGGVFPGTGGSNPTATMEVYQGATQISAGPAAIVPPNAWTAQSFTFDASLVTDWTDVRLRFSVSSTGGSQANGRGGAVSWAEIEAPDAAAQVYNLTFNAVGVAITPRSLGLNTQRLVNFDPVSISLTPQQVAFNRAYTLSLNSTAVALTPQDITFLRGLRLGLEAVGIGLSPSALNLNYQRLLNLDSVSISIAAQALQLNKAYRLDLNPASTSLSVQQLQLQVARVLNLDPAAITITPRALTLNYGALNSYLLELNPLAVALTPQSLELSHHRLLQIESTSVALQPRDIEFLRQYVLGLDAAHVNIFPTILALNYSEEDPPGGVSMEYHTINLNPKRLIFSPGGIQEDQGVFFLKDFFRII